MYCQVDSKSKNIFKYIQVKQNLGENKWQIYYLSIIFIRWYYVPTSLKRKRRIICTYGLAVARYGPQSVWPTSEGMIERVFLGRVNVSVETRHWFQKNLSSSESLVNWTWCSLNWKVSRIVSPRGWRRIKQRIWFSSPIWILTNDFQVAVILIISSVSGEVEWLLNTQS